MSAAVAGAGLGAASSLMQTSKQNEQIEQQAQAQEYAAAETLISGQSRAANIRSQADQVTGATKAAAAGSGVQVDTGSVLDVIEESAFNIELDALTTESDARRSYTNQMATAASTRSSKASSFEALLGAVGSGASGYASGAQAFG